MSGRTGPNIVGTDPSPPGRSFLSKLFATPDLLPAAIDFPRDTMTFIPMSRESFRRHSFLDSRFVRPGPRSFSIGLAELLSACSEARPLPLHFILHGAFCGSTLMARHLEELPHCFVLKEPGLLAQLARLKRGAFDPVPFEPSSWADWFKVTMALAARGYPGDVAVIIKPNDVGNWMGHLLLDHDERTRIIFLASPLQSFLLSVLKQGDRRQWARGRIRQLAGFLVQMPGLNDLAADDLDDGQCAAVLWLLNSFLCSSLQERPDADRIRALNSEDLIGSPRETLREAAEFFGLTRDEANRTALTALRPLDYSAKFPDVAYDSKMRDSDRADAERRFGAEAEAAISWAEQVGSGWLSRSSFPIR